MNHKAKLWFRTDALPYDGNEPAFFDPNLFDWAKYLIDNWYVIRNELNALIDNDTDMLLKPYFESNLQSSKTNWRTEGFYFWTLANRPFINRFPQTHEILKNIPGLLGASVNLLESNSEIKAHEGDTNAIFRCHLGLSIPSGLPNCGFRVKDVHKAWAESQMLIFIDAFNHEAYNHTGSKKIDIAFGRNTTRVY
jgi:aspartyl/asparaginyl beta-hydroxylase (cupin superfamily)